MQCKEIQSYTSFWRVTFFKLLQYTCFPFCDSAIYYSITKTANRSCNDTNDSKWKCFSLSNFVFSLVVSFIYCTLFLFVGMVIIWYRKYMPLAKGRIKEVVGKFKTKKEGFTYYYACIIMPPNIANFFLRLGTPFEQLLWSFSYGRLEWSWLPMEQYMNTEFVVKYLVCSISFVNTINHLFMKNVLQIVFGFSILIPHFCLFVIQYILQLDIVLQA